MIQHFIILIGTSLFTPTTMKSRLHQTPALIAITVILAIVVSFPAILCQKPQPYEVCGKSVQCGDIQLQYPFWGAGRPAYCGHPGFELACDDNVSRLTYDDKYYRVLDMNNSTQTITVARSDLWTNLCDPFQFNTSFNTTLFNIDSSRHRNLSLFYVCDTSKPMLPMETNQEFLCAPYQTNTTFGYFLFTDQILSNMTSYLDDCRDQIIVPVGPYLAGRIATPSLSDADLRSAIMAGFNLQWMAKNDKCDECIRSHGRCGSNPTSPELFACYCGTGNFSLSCNELNRSGGSHVTAWKLIVGLLCSIGVIMILLFVIVCQRKMLRDTQKAANHRIEMFIKNHETLAPKRYKYSEIKKITNSFLEKLGQGGFGSVYKGQLPNGQLVAVKMLGGVTGKGEDFINEVGSISRTSHVNIVSLLGFCIDGNKRALIYEFMPNGSLDKFLRRDGSRLDWNTLFGIAKGIARGLEYLHRGCSTRIVHFDIKPHNILLDEEFVPKISDFGMAKLFNRKDSIVTVTGAKGTAGYMAPEIFFKSFGGVSHKSDVYSFGMMVLEMTGARKNNMVSTSETHFPDTIYKKVEGGEDLGVDGVTTNEEEELARKMVMVSLWCIQSDPSDRPSISKVVEMLEGSFRSLQVPPKHFWSSFKDPSSSLTQTSSEVLTIQIAREDLSS